MELVVYLALFVLASVFCFSLFILVVMCKRRAVAVQRFRRATALRFTKLNDGNVDSVVHLSPLIAQILDSNQWVYDVPGILQHCVVLLKMCHTLIEKLASISSNGIAPKLNNDVLTATTRIMPRFDDLLRAIAADQIDVRLLEARGSSLVSACWALAFPFSVISPNHVDQLEAILNEMEEHIESLRLIVHQAERGFGNEQKIQEKDVKASSPLETVIEETALLDEADQPSPQQSDDAPADPGTVTVAEN